MTTSQAPLHALEAAIISADAALDALTEAERAHAKALKALCALTGAADYGEALNVYEQTKAKQERGHEH